jgi:hypothetical protein
MNQEEALKNLKRKILDKKNKVEAMVFELREINETLSQLSIKDSIEVLNNSILSLSEGICQLKNDNQVSDIKLLIKTQQKTFEKVLGIYLEKIERILIEKSQKETICKTVNSNPMDIDISLRPKSLKNELVCYRNNLYLCIDNKSLKFKKINK